MHVVAHRGCTNTVRESAMKVDSGENVGKIPCWRREIESESVLRLAFRFDALPTDMLPPLSVVIKKGSYLRRNTVEMAELGRIHVWAGHEIEKQGVKLETRLTPS